MDCKSFLFFVLFCTWKGADLQQPFEQGILFTANNPLLFSEGNRTRFIIQCQPLNNGTGFSRVTAIRISRKTEYSQTFTPVISLTENQPVVQWRDDSIRQRSDRVSARIGNPFAAFIRYEIPPERTDCTDASYYRCEMDGTTLRFQRVIFITSQVVESNILFLEAAPSNAPSTSVQTRSRVYTVGTSVWLACAGRTGNPPFPLRWCIQEGNGSFTEHLGDDNMAFSSDGSNARNSCILTQTIFTTYTIRDEDTQRPLTFRCEIAFPVRPVCHQENLPRGSEDVVISGVPRESQITTTVSGTTTTTNAPRVDVTSPDLGVNMGFNDSQSESAVLILGIILVVVAVTGIITAAGCLLKARKIKTETELMLTRSTYDALQKPHVAMETYQTIDSGVRTRTLQVDNDGYIVAR